jgi:hypothetical protein
VGIMLDILKQHRTAVLLVVLGLSLFLRAGNLGAAGLSEDEAHKVEAGRAYLRGDFFVNLEHPMLMKSMVAVSMIICDAWNRHASPANQVSEEVAVRLPNVVFGSLTAIVIFLMAEEIFGFTVGLIGSLLWSTGILTITINRVAKEDTLLVFFTWLAFFLYMKAKNLGNPSSARNPRTARQKLYYTLAGASFGLMLASKYLPHYFGLNMLYYHLVGRNEKNQPLRGSLALVLGALGLTFLIANPVILSPSVLKYFVGYVGEGTMTHHGYYMMEHLYHNSFLFRPGSTPVYYYGLLLLLKTPLPLLGALVVGLVLAFRQRKNSQHFFPLFMFLWWIIPFSFSGGKFLRYALSAMPMVCIISARGIVKLFELLSEPMRADLPVPIRAFAGAFLALFLATPLFSALSSAPFYSLYLNPLGAGRAAYYFPHDEIYDAGLREAIKDICEKAPPGATVAGESPLVFKYYLARFGRSDLSYFNLSDLADKNGGMGPTNAMGPTYMVVQEGRKYFENIDLIDRLEAFSNPIQTVRIGAATAASLYKVEDVAQLRRTDQLIVRHRADRIGAETDSRPPAEDLEESHRFRFRPAG